MLLRGITALVLFQLLGSALQVLLLPMLPGPIIGLLLLFAWLLLNGEVSPAINEGASALLRYLPLLLVPPSAGVILYAEQLADDLLALAFVLSLSLVLSLWFSGFLMQRLIERQQRLKHAKEHRHD
ncbi:CidA/LrgA family protein [Atopomonas sediminilitoris]|uniref:CidA/LrgA family protein n=1 Tax=Atopomonas sediminilitoris TaxID=2919919 RepID=UPI001F4E3E79|nr:CidA/LrgA family protein [Atopomonas sediminilitoris]MCJ8170607.1 CidA/LrgA family protein [Atopomonas sediminilitoris]